MPLRMLDRILFTSLALIWLLACGAEKRQATSITPNAGRSEEVPKVAISHTSESAPRTESASVHDEEGEAALTFHVEGGLTYVQRESELYVIEPGSLTVLAKISSPDGTLPACIVAHPSRHRFLLVSQSGLLSLWESNGRLIAKGQRPVGRTTCWFRVSWDLSGDRFLTNFDQDLGLPWAGIWAWRNTGASLEPTRVASVRNSQAEFLQRSDGVWISRIDGSFQIVTLEGKVLHTFMCEQCVLSPDERLIAVNQLSPHRHTRLVDLTTGSTLWESSIVSAHVWSPSLRWLLGTNDQGPVIIDASDGLTLARWARLRRKTANAVTPTGPEAALTAALNPQPSEDARWFGDLLVETDGQQVVFWKEGAARPRIEKGVANEGLADIAVAHGGDRFLTKNTIWSVQGKRLIGLEAVAPGRGTAEAWSADDRYLDGSNDRGLIVWDSRSGKIVSRLENRILEQYVRSWSLHGHDLLVSEGPALLRHTPGKGTFRITPQHSSGKLTFDVQAVVSWSRDSSGAED